MQRNYVCAAAIAFVLSHQIALADSRDSSAKGGPAPHGILSKAQAGYYRLKIGDIDVIALSDGTLAFPTDDLLLNAKPGEIHQLLDDAFDPSPLASVNAYLIFLKGKVILVDTGAETLLGPTLGKLPGSLIAAGIRSSDITDVFLTHIHPDHAGGLMIGNRKAFPNAVVHVEQQDLDYWLNSAAESAAPDLIKPFFAQAEAKMRPYMRDGQVKTFTGATQFFPGFSAEPAYGHTPGHTSFVLESQGEKMVFLGDTTHVLNIQFADPGIGVKFDSNVDEAIAQRRRRFLDASQARYLLAFTHVSFPGVGHLRKEGDHFEWIPVSYVDDASHP